MTAIEAAYTPVDDANGWRLLRTKTVVWACPDPDGIFHAVDSTSWPPPCSESGWARSRSEVVFVCRASGPTAPSSG